MSEFESSLRGGRSLPRLLCAAGALQGWYGRTNVATGGGQTVTSEEQGNHTVEGELKLEFQSELELGPVRLPKSASDWSR